MIMYQGALTFSTVAFPALTRHLPEVRRSAQEVQSRNKTLRDHGRFEPLSRNRVSNVSFAVSSLGETFILAMMVGILEAIKAEDSSENNTRAFSVLIAFSGGVWLLCALPWFPLEKRRPGTSLLTIGFRQTYVTRRECFRLEQTFPYPIFYFLVYVYLAFLPPTIVSEPTFTCFRGDVLNITV